MENLENQTAVSHLSHRPLEIAKDAIPTFPPRRRWSPFHEYGKQKTKTPFAPSGRSRQSTNGAFIQRWNTCPSALRQGIKSCVLSPPPMAGFEVTPYGRF